MKIGKILDDIAEENGYTNKNALLRDYRVIPTVLTPKHRTIELIPLFCKHLIKEIRNSIKK